MAPFLSSLRVRAGGLKQRIHERLLWIKAGRPIRAARIFSDPPIIYWIHHQEWGHQLAALHREFGQHKGILLVGFWWVQKEHNLPELRKLTVWMSRQMPNWQIRFLCNSEAEFTLLRSANLDAEFINQNCFINESIFTVKPLVQKKFDAVYDGQLIIFKRHELAREVRSLSLISYKYAMNFDPAYGKATQESLAQATWINNPMLPAYRMLNEAEVATHLNEARVGLCLSAEEGAMYASIQYLLCGLPIVSTRSIGGRDVFFNDTDCLIVEDTPQAVAAGVKTMVARQLPPHDVRARAIVAIERHRVKFIAMIQHYLDGFGVHASYEPMFRENFTNKLVRLTNAAELAAPAK